MQNDMLKNTIAPWQEKGRWYHATYTWNGSSMVMDPDRTDPHIAGLPYTAYLTISDKTEVPLDVKMKIITDITPTNISNIGFTIWMDTVGRYRLTCQFFNNLAVNDTLELWIFNVKK